MSCSNWREADNLTTNIAAGAIISKRSAGVGAENGKANYD
jgi:hypothetical protein